MSDAAFVDTNVFLYAHDDANPLKRDRARDLIDRIMAEQTGRISLQVLQEFFANVTRKFGMDPEAARLRVALYATIQVVPLDTIDLLAAITFHRTYQVSIWDALILRAAEVSGCRHLYTEDLQPGFRIGRLEVVNPFADL